MKARRIADAGRRNGSAGAPPPGERLAPCPHRPNCVCSEDGEPPRRRIEPFAVVGDPAVAFLRLKDLAAAAPRTEIDAATDVYLHAACRTRLGFVDDLEFRLCSEKRVIHVRSASRIGYSDLGANRARVEALRRRFLAAQPNS